MESLIISVRCSIFNLVRSIVTLVIFARACNISIGANELKSLILSRTELYSDCIVFCGEVKRFSPSEVLVAIVLELLTTYPNTVRSVVSRFG